MKLKDLDNETRLVVYLATIMADRPSDDTLARLKDAVDKFRDKHEQEMLENLLAVIFPEGVPESKGKKK